MNSNKTELDSDVTFKHREFNYDMAGIYRKRRLNGRRRLRVRDQDLIWDIITERLVEVLALESLNYG